MPSPIWNGLVSLKSVSYTHLDVYKRQVVNRLEDLAVPTICRLNGGVYGGSTDLALACDFRIGVDSAEMFMPCLLYTSRCV